MRRSGDALPWQTCMKPCSRPRRTCSAEATAIQFPVIAVLSPGSAARVGEGGVSFRQQSRLWRLDALALAPLPQQCLPTAGVACVGRDKCRDPVGAEMAEVLAQLAPGDDHLGVVEEAEGKGPDQSLARRRAPVAIA